MYTYNHVYIVGALAYIYIQYVHVHVHIIYTLTRVHLQWGLLLMIYIYKMKSYPNLAMSIAFFFEPLFATYVDLHNVSSCHFQFEILKREDERGKIPCAESGSL